MGDAETAELRPGALISASLRLVRPLAEGGMGRVWVAEHLGLRTLVAVKFIAAALLEDDGALDRFSREAAAASQVKSPHVAQPLDYGLTTGGTPFIAMELLEGRDLAMLIGQFGVLDPVGVAKIVAQVCRALTKAHERGIVHRDIKPENIFLIDAGGGDLFAKVLDFGIAKSGLDRGTRATGTGMMLGTPVYMSPEQVMGDRAVDARSDLWSLGVVAFEALTGGLPFTGETIGAISVAITHDTIPRPSTRNPALGPPIDAWFARACSRDITTRFQSARELADALDAAVVADAAIEIDPNDATISIVGPHDVQSAASMANTAVLPGSGAMTPRTAARLTAKSLEGETTIALQRVSTNGATVPDDAVLDRVTRAPRAPRSLVIGGAMAALAIVVIASTVVLTTRTPTAAVDEEDEAPRHHRATSRHHAADDDEEQTPLAGPSASSSTSTAASVSASTSAPPVAAPTAAQAPRAATPTPTSVTPSPKASATPKKPPKKKPGYTLE